MSNLQTDINSLITASGAEQVSVAAFDFASGESLEIDADYPFHPASTFKLCVMMELYRQAEKGIFSLDDPLLLKNEFPSYADGLPFSNEKEDDAEPSLYDRLGQTETLREICRLMIVRSSNLATNLLLEVVPAQKVTEFMRALGAPDLVVLRGPEDGRAFALGLNNCATARGLAHILRLLAEGKVVSEIASREMMDVLLQQELNEGIPAQLRPDAKVAHKNGWINHHYHDAGVVLQDGKAPIVIVVMTKGLAEDSAGPKLVSDISKALVGGWI